MPHPIALAALAGLISSGLFLSLLTGLPGMVLFAYFVQLPLFVIGLSLGLASSMIAVAGGVLVSGLIAGAVSAVIYGVVQGLPALFVVRQALLSRAQDGRVEWYPLGPLLAQLSLIGAAALSLAFLVSLSQPGGLRGAVEALLVGAMREFGVVTPEAAAPAGFDRYLFLFPGLMAASWLVMVVVNFLAGQAIAVRLHWNRRPSPDFDGLELPWWLLPVLGAAAILSLLGGEGPGFLGRAALIVLVVPYGFLGLAVLHVLAKRWSHPGLALVLIYGGIVVLGWPLLGVLLLGFIEDWAGLRRRLV